jgi:hypothetical protein
LYFISFNPFSSLRILRASIILPFPPTRYRYIAPAHFDNKFRRLSTKYLKGSRARDLQLRNLPIIKIAEAVEERRMLLRRESDGIIVKNKSAFSAKDVIGILEDREKLKDAEALENYSLDPEAYNHMCEEEFYFEELYDQIREEDDYGGAEEAEKIFNAIDSREKVGAGLRVTDPNRYEFLLNDFEKAGTVKTFSEVSSSDERPHGKRRKVISNPAPLGAITSALRSFKGVGGISKKMVEAEDMEVVESGGAVDMEVEDSGGFS